MTATNQLAVSDRLVQPFQHLGISKAHFASRGLGDLTDFAAQYPEMFASLTLVCPSPPPDEIVKPLGSKLLIFRGDRMVYDGLEQLTESLPGTMFAVLENDIPWSDLIARHADEIQAAWLPFLAKQTTADLSDLQVNGKQYGAVAGISYHIAGSGPPLVLMPLGLVPSQWDPVMPILAEKYCTITLGGAELGMVSLLEKRATTVGYLDMVETLVRKAQLQPGDTVLEVGCGTGALDRWLARHTDCRNPITGVDINRYFLREASDMARNDGLNDVVQFKVGDATKLPFEDNQFDLTMSVTVLEEVNADKALAEIIRVTKPGGTVGVIVRAKDIPYFVNLPLNETAKAKLQHPSAHGSDAGDDGCADASLYQRFQASELTDVKMFPYLAPFNEEFVLDLFPGAVGHVLDQAEQPELQQACEQARTDGTFVWSYPHHCAVGKKP